MRIAVTSGEPAGVGPEITVALAQWFSHYCAINKDCPVTELVLYGDRYWLEDNGLDLASLSQVSVCHIPLVEPAKHGQLEVRNAAYVLGQLSRAADDALGNKVDALVTAPIHKGIVNQSGVPFSGHTEFFQQRAQSPKVVMMLACDDLRVALATTHLPLREVPDTLTVPLLMEVMSIIHSDLSKKFGLVQPRIAVCGLNPHAGEQGHIGLEELTVIEPAIRAAQAQGWSVEGPFPADTIFVEHHAQHFDVILAMYHDQGLPVLKRASFGAGVNVTLGLPFIRTSVDHGTALAIAGQNKAETGSLRQAFLMATHMCQQRNYETSRP